jgi:hypothetical protein
MPCPYPIFKFTFCNLQRGAATAGCTYTLVAIIAIS